MYRLELMLMHQVVQDVQLVLKTVMEIEVTVG
jgi:hypothetical protein